MKRMLALLAGAALAFGVSVSQAKTPKDTLVLAMNIDDIISFDPAQVFELVGGEMIANIYDRITTHEPDNLTELTGGATESWTVSDDGRVITLKVRPGQKFHSGNPLTAHDVVFSLRRTVKLEQTPVFLLNQFGWKPDNVDKLVTATDPSTVRLEITEKLAPTLVLNVLSAGVGSVVDMKTAMAHEKDGDMGHEWLKTNTAGSGPYQLRSWKPNEGVILEANAAYRHGAPAMKRLVFRHVPEPAAQRLLIEKGDVDIARNLSTDQVAGLTGNADIRIQEDPKALLKYLQINMKDPVLSKPKVREALRYLVDYEGMVGSFLKGQFRVHQSFWPSGFFASLTATPFKLDVARAKALLAEAGHADGLEIELDAFNDSPHVEMAQSVQETMAKAGVKVKILQADKKAVYTKHRGRQHQMILSHWSPDYLDPHSNADAFSSNPDNSDGAKLTGVIAWRGSWETPANTAVTSDAKAELDPGTRRGMYLALQRSVQMDSPFIFMFQNVSQSAVRNNVKGFVSGPSFDLVYYRLVTKS